MLKAKRALLIACSVILLCTSAVVGMTYSLFTDSVSVENHLRAGTLNVELVRCNLKYAVPDEDGYLYEDSIQEECDFTDVTESNIFGLDSTEIRIVPGCYFEATLELRNKGDIAFTYNVGIKMTENSELARQLKLTLLDAEGNALLNADGNEIHAKMLSELAEGITVTAGEMSAEDTVESFIVRVEFIDHADYNTSNMTEDEKLYNNDAMGGSARFDLVVTAVQATH